MYDEVHTTTLENSSDKLRHRISVLNVVKLPHLMFQ